MNQKPIQILIQTADGIAIDSDLLFPIIDKIGENHVAIITITGGKRTGKTLLLNFFLKYLKNNQRSEDSVIEEIDSVLNGFDLRDGTKQQDIGIWLWPEPLSVKTKDGSEIFLLLLDTEGLSLEKTNIQNSGNMFSLCLLFSSILIFNYKNEMNDEHWNFFEKFSQFAQSIYGESDSYQKLVFLVRDWDDEQSYCFGFHDDSTAEFNNYKKNIIDSNDTLTDKAQKTRISLLSRFGDIGSYLMPHPGKSVTKPSFKGQLECFDKDFIDNVEIFVKTIIENIEPKQIGFSKLTANSLKDYLRKWIDMISNKKSKQNNDEEINELENTKEIEKHNEWEEIIETNPELAFDKALELYEKSIKLISETNPSDEEMDIKHKIAQKESLEYLSSEIINKVNDNEIIDKLRERTGKIFEEFRTKNLQRIEDEKCKAISDYPKENFSEKSDKCIYLELQCPGSYRKVCESEQKLWSCAECGQLLEYDFDEYFYCCCGRANVYSFKYKCNSKKHSFDFIKFADIQIKQMLVSKEINILILGETGVGKSTWINGFVNYITYPLLTDATKQELLSLISSSFIMTDNKYKRREIKCGVDTNEAQKTIQSATQQPKAYTFDCDNKLIRLIDTPGIGDTRGIDQDKKNFDAILRYLSNYDKLHGICILLKPNNARLGVMFRFCIKELLTHLHRDASRNIVFCFTNARSTFYRPGDTMPALESLLGENREVEIKLSNKTIYCMDNESFRFLCAIHHGIEFDEKECANYSESWDKSVVETKRMLDYICGLTPHAVSNTLSLNDTRKMIVTLSRPMADITQNIFTNISVVEDKKKEIQNCEENEKNLSEKLYMEVIQLEAIQLGYPRTVCTDKNCVKYHNIEGTKQYTTEFVTHCHTHCYLTGITPEKYPNPELKNCDAMNDTENCNTCECSWEKHMHVTYEHKQNKIKVIDIAVDKLLKNKQTVRQGIELHIKKMEQFVNELNDEKNTITKVSAKFGNFLKANSIVPYNDALGEYLDVLIRMENDKVSAGGDRKTLENLQQMRKSYDEEVKLLDRYMKIGGKSKQLTTKDVKDLVNKLYSLPHKGNELKQIMDVVSSSTSQMQKFQETNYRSKYSKKTANFLKKPANTVETTGFGVKASVDFLKMQFDFVKNHYNKFKLPSVPFFTDRSKPTNITKTTNTPNISTTNSAQKTYQNTSIVKRAPKAPKNWDKIVKELEEEDKEEEGVDDMFKKLYADGDEDTKRAMIKSLYESKGTTLSMNWAEVGSKFVKPYENK